MTNPLHTTDRNFTPSRSIVPLRRWYYKDEVVGQIGPPGTHLEVWQRPTKGSVHTRIPEDDALLVAGLTEALSKASVIGNRGATAKRQRCNFDELVQEYGSYFDRTYRMSHDSFMKLHSILFDTLDTANKGPNGGIDSRLKLSVATHYFAGGDPLDIMASHKRVS